MVYVESMEIFGWWLFRYANKIPAAFVKISSWLSVGIIAFLVYIQAIELPQFSAFVKKAIAKEIVFDLKEVPKAGLLHRVSFY